MGKKILDSKILYVVLSILISLSLWLWVISRDENRETRPYNLPITFEGVDILEDRSLMIVNPNVTVSVNIRATPMILAALNENPPKLTANVSNINTEGTQRVAYSYSLPTGVSQSDVEFIARNSSGMAVDVDIARFLRRENVEIRGEFQGSAAEGYLPGDNDDFRFSPGTLTISGRAELVNQVAYAKVTVTDQGLTEEVGKDMPFQLIGASGDPLDLDVTCDVDMIYTSFPIRATAEIPLEVRIVDGGGLSSKDVKVETSVESIMVAGTREVVDGMVSLGAITLATIDLATLDDEVVENGGELTVPIPLDDQLENISGITEVTITIKVTKRGVETREFTISRISTINVPEGWTPGIITQELRVKIRGTAALLDELDVENIMAVADMKDVSPASGPYTMTPIIYLNSAGSTVTDVGVVNPNGYSVVVSLSRGG